MVGRSTLPENKLYPPIWFKKPGLYEDRHSHLFVILPPLIFQLQPLDKPGSAPSVLRIEMGKVVKFFSQESQTPYTGHEPALNQRRL